MNLANYAPAELTCDPPAFFALIWNNEVSNKVTHQVLSMRPGCWRQTGPAGNWKEAWRLALQPAAIWMLQGPHAASRSPAGASDQWRAYQRGLTPLGRRSQKVCVLVKTLPCMMNAEAAGGIHTGGRVKKQAKLNRLSRPALKTILWSNSSQTGVFGTQAKTNKSFRWLVLAEASVADLKAWSDYKKGSDKEVRRQRMSGTKVLGAFIFFLPDSGILYYFFPRTELKIRSSRCCHSLVEVDLIWVINMPQITTILGCSAVQIRLSGTVGEFGSTENGLHVSANFCLLVSNVYQLFVSKFSIKALQIFTNLRENNFALGNACSLHWVQRAWIHILTTFITV